MMDADKYRVEQALKLIEDETLRLRVRAAILDPPNILALKQQIDGMTQAQMAAKQRFAPIGDPMFCGEVADYFFERFESLGGMTPAISKEIGLG